MVGLLAAWALLLAWSGLAKVVAPAAAARSLTAARIPGHSLLARTPVVRLTGLAEIAVAAAVIVVGGRLPAAALAVTYLLLGLVAWRMVRVSPGQDCGCFGRASEPISRWHVAVNLTGAALGLIGVIWPTSSLVGEIVDQSLSGAILLVALTLLLSWLCYQTMTALPALLEFRRKVAGPR